MGSSLWSQVIGHDAVLAALERGLEHGRGAQGYLFAGPAGVGKTLVARGLGQRLNCRAEQPACGVCPVCVRIAGGHEPNVRVVEPEQMGGSGAFRPRLHKVEAIRRLLHETDLKGYDAGWRVFVLRGAEFLREEAANTLLKTLEEPPERTVFVLTSEQPAALLPTITSRLRRLDFGLVSTAAVEAWLVHANGVSSAQAAVCAGIGAGRPARALAVALNPGTQRFRRELLGRIAEIARQPAVAALRVAGWLQTDGEDGVGAERVAWALDLLEWWYRDALVLAVGGDARWLVNRDQSDELAEFAAQWEPAQLHACLSWLQRARLALMRNGNAQLTLEVLWLALARGGGRPGRAAS